MFLDAIFEGAPFQNDDDARSMGSFDNDGISSEGSRAVLNESAMEAADDKRRHIELSKIDAEDIWGLFMDTSRRGGQLARTIFVSAKKLEPSICTPWPGSSSILTKKQQKLDQRSEFLSWADEKRVIEWIRLAIYNTVIGTQKTYQFLIVTHSGVATRLDGSAMPITVANFQATNNNMARIGHLACHSDSRMVLNMIYGSKDRELVGDNPELTPDALWQNLAELFVNNPDWDIATIHVPEVPEIDISCVPPQPGLSGDTVKKIFGEIKQSYQDLFNKTFGKTGCNSTGEAFYTAVWERWINGGMLTIKNKPVLMYVFKLWNVSGDGLPKYCTKDIHAEAAVRAGINLGNAPQSPFVLSTRGNASSSFSSPASLAQSKMQDSLDSVQLYCKTQLKLQPTFEVLRFIALAKLLLFHHNQVPNPDAALSALLTAHKVNVLKEWALSKTMLLLAATSCCLLLLADACCCLLLLAAASYLILLAIACCCVLLLASCCLLLLGAVCCCLLPPAAACCCVPLRAAACCCVLQRAAVCCCVLLRAAACCCVLLRAAAC